MLSLTGCGGGGAGSASTNSTSLTNSGASSGLSSGTSSGGGGVTAVTGGVVADPYIKGATFFEDANGNGQWDQGEQVSTVSNGNGQFNFTNPIPAGHTIIMLQAGYDQGEIYTGRLMYKVKAGDPQSTVISPLTTLAAYGFSAADLAAPLALLGSTSNYDINADPMAGLGQIVSADDPGYSEAVTNLRADLYAGAVLDLFMLNRDPTAITTQDLSNFFNNWAPLPDLMEGLQYAVSADAIGRISNLLPSGYDNLPPVTMREVAESMPTILDWWKQEIIDQVIAGGNISISVNDFEAKVDSVQPELGLRCYVRNNQNNKTVQQAVAAGDLPTVGAGSYAYLQKDGSISTTTQTLKWYTLVGQTFLVGNNSQLRFFNDSSGNGGTVELTYSDDSGATTTLDGTWRIEANNNNIVDLQGNDSNEVLPLEFETDWSGHLSMHINVDAKKDYASTSFLGKLLQENSQFKVLGS